MNFQYPYPSTSSPNLLVKAGRRSLVLSVYQKMKSFTYFLAFGCAAAFSASRGNGRLRTAIFELDQGEISRRHFGSELASFVGVFSAYNWVNPAWSKASQEEIDKANIVKGYDRLNYLLDNWVKETTICGQSDNPYISEKGCERTPLKVMEYLGYKNINDPLFKADKTMRRLEALVPPDRETEYIDAVEKWSETADEASGMAFVSSWGEANPGGGKDRVELFIERAKTNVMDARDSLQVVVEILGLKQP